jgi:hypothetical protein
MNTDRLAVAVCSSPEKLHQQDNAYINEIRDSRQCNWDGSVFLRIKKAVEEKLN